MVPLTTIHTDSNHELVDGSLHDLDLTLQLSLLIRCDTGSNDGSRNTASPSESCLRFDEDVRYILVENGERCRR